MAPYRFLSGNRYRLASSYLFLITCELACAAAPTVTNHQPQLVSTPSVLQNSATTPQLSSSKPRINVSKVCEQTGIHVTVRTSRPFFGLIHAKDKRRKSACATEGAGQQLFTMQFDYATPEHESYCGLVVQRVPVQPAARDPNLTERRIMSLILVVRLHKTIESSEDQFFLLSCSSSSLPLTNDNHHNQLQKSDCANNRPSNQSTVRDDQSEEAFYKLTTSHQIANKWADSLLTPQLELHYQWLVHVSCTLAALLAITLCVALWLCGTRYSGSRPVKQTRDLSSKQILYTSSQSSDKSTQSTDENSSISDEIAQSSMPSMPRAALMNARHHVVAVHSLKRPTKSHLESQVDQRNSQGQVLINTFDPEQAVNYFNTSHHSIANSHFGDLCFRPALEESRVGPLLESATLMKQQEMTTNSLASDAHMYRLQSKSNPIISQFDPQDSRQLLDLIQQKQLQQIPQQGNMNMN